MKQISRQLQDKILFHQNTCKASENLDFRFMRLNDKAAKETSDFKRLILIVDRV